MTVRELIAQYSSRLLSSQDMKADEASNILVELSALSGNVNEEIVTRQMTYNRLLSSFIDTPNMSAAKAKIRAESSQDYEALLRAEKSLTVVVEMVRALKYRLKVLADEKQVASNQ